MQRSAEWPDPRVALNLRGDSFSMREFRPVLSGLLVAGFLLGLSSLSGCGDPREGSAPKKKGTRDEINKAFYDQPGNVPATTTKKRGRE
jgi:hypothetical protein